MHKKLTFLVALALVALALAGQAHAGCLTRGGKVIVPPKVPPGQRVAIGSVVAGATYDFRGNPIVALPTGHMLELPYAGADTCVTGAKIVGTEPRTLGWDEVKAKYDHGGISWVHASAGNHIIENSWIENVEDSIYMPRDGSGPYESNVTVTGSYGRYGRDDMVEADGCFHFHSIIDSLFEQQHTAFSARPSSGESVPTNRDGVWTVRDSLIGFSCKPDKRSKADGGGGGCPKGLSVGGLFKDSACFGTVNFRDVILKIDAVPVSGKEHLLFPVGSTTQNVTIVWTGPGAYPGNVPAGVRVTKDPAVWTAARKGWLGRHGCTTDASGGVTDCAFLHR